jgi:DDE superfamily endonuclease
MSKVTHRPKNTGKKLAQTIKQVQQDYPEAAAEVWAEGEHRIGLHPVNRMVWVPRGEVPIAKVNGRFKGSWLVGFVNPQSGQTYWWTVPRLNSKVFSLLLEDFAEYFGLGQNKRVILTIDQAAFHTSGQVRVPEGIHILEMPPKSPELQPAERSWRRGDQYNLRPYCLSILD